MKHPYVHSLVLETLLPLMAEELMLNDSSLDGAFLNEVHSGDFGFNWPWEQSPVQFIESFLTGILQFAGLTR